MSRATLTMSHTELERLEVIQRVRERRLTQEEAAGMLGLGLRQVQRLCAAYRDRGAAGLVSAKRGRQSNRRLPDELRRRAMELVRARYADFGPTLAAENLYFADRTTFLLCVDTA